MQSVLGVGKFLEVHVYTEKKLSIINLFAPEFFQEASIFKMTPQGSCFGSTFFLSVESSKIAYIQKSNGHQKAKMY